MTSGGDELFVTVGGRDIGLQSLLQKIDTEMQTSAKSAVQLGQQYARLAQAQGQPALASQVLAGTMQRAGAASERSLIGLATQQANLGNSSRNLTSTIAGLGGQFSQLGGTAGALAGQIGGLAGGMGALGGIGAAIGIAKIGVDMAVAGAGADLLRERFDGLAVAAGTTGEALITALRAASSNEISDLNLTLAANKAQLLGVADSAEEFSVLMGIARDRAQEMGISTTQAFDNLTTGLGRGSALILDNLGIIVSVKEANEQYAASLGRTAASLTEAEQKQALINQVLAQGRASLAATGGAVESNAGAFQRAGVAVQNFGNAFGSELAARIGPTLNVLVGINDQWQNLINGSSQSAAAVATAAAQATAATAALAAFDAEMARSGDTAAAEAAYQQALAASLAQSAATAAQTTAATAALSGAYDANRAAVLGNIGATDAHTAALAATAQALVDETTKKMESAAAAERLSAFQAELASLGGAVAGGLQTAGAAAAQLASQYNIATGAALQLIQAQAALAQSKVNAAALVDQRAGERSPGRSGVAESAAQEQARLNAIYKKLVIPPIKAPKVGGGGGGGAPKLSDQTKLQNSLLASQEQYEQKSEDAVTQHAVDVEKIMLDFYDKMREADRDFNQAQLEGRAGFYDQLGSIESPKIAQAASAAYEAAAIEAGKIAQEKGADVAEKYMSAQEQIISARAKRLDEIEKASNKKDKKTFDPDRAEYLKGVDAQYRKAEDAKLARIKEGEGSLAAERDKQLDDAAAKEADALDKISVASDRATEKKILGSERSGKKIDEEMLKVDGLAASYDRLGAAGTRAGITPAAGTTPAAPGTTPAATAATPAPAEDNPVVSALNAAAAAIVAALSSVEKAERDTGGAVRSLKSSGGIAG